MCSTLLCRFGGSKYLVRRYDWIPKELRGSYRETRAGFESSVRDGRKQNLSTFAPKSCLRPAHCMVMCVVCVCVPLVVTGILLNCFAFFYISRGTIHVL